MRLEGKTAVITGGGTGIGEGIAKAFAVEGCRVVIAGRREEPLKQVADDWTGAGSVEYHTMDVSCLNSVQEFFDWVADSVGQVDILVNSAGTNIPNRTIAEMNPEQWDQVMAINASGAYYTMYAILPQMRERGDGIVINISSISGIRSTALGGVARAFEAGRCRHQGGRSEGGGCDGSEICGDEIVDDKILQFKSEESLPPIPHHPLYPSTASL